jgi:hypothetical protein
MLAEFRQERDRVDEAIAVLARLAAGVNVVAAHRHG